MAERSDAATIVVTGAGGYIGRTLVERLAARGMRVTALLRRPAAPIQGAELRVAGDLDAGSDWPALLRGARAAVHLAARAHAPPGDEAWIESEATMAAAMARAAMAAGLERLVLLSSIKVAGEATQDRRFHADEPPAPRDAYGRAKLRIETMMRETAGERLAIIRPPLVYGAGVKANFRALIRLVDAGVPLPFASIDNRRSLVFLENLVDLIETVLVHPAAAGGQFLLRDDEEASTPTLARLIARALGRPARLFPFPPGLLLLAASFAGQRSAAERLVGSLQVDDRATREILGWRPRVGLAEGIAATCRWYREARR